jgi:hypothetical protein
MEGKGGYSEKEAKGYVDPFLGSDLFLNLDRVIAARSSPDGDDGKGSA